MAELPSWIAQYGQLGVMLWMVFEIRDMRRWFASHLETHHAQPKAGRDG
jgi:hypothetical protein